MAAREAMAYGRPVVATRVGGLADLDGPGVTLVPPGDGRGAPGRDRRGAVGTRAAPAVRALPRPRSAAALRDVYEAALR